MYRLQRVPDVYAWNQRQCDIIPYLSKLKSCFNYNVNSSDNDKKEDIETDNKDNELDNCGWYPNHFLKWSTESGFDRTKNVVPTLKMHNNNEYCIYYDCTQTFFLQHGKII